MNCASSSRITPPATRKQRQVALPSAAYRRIISRCSSAKGVQSMTSGATDTSDAISLENIRQSLIRQEESIIFTLIERAQFKRNQPVYVPGEIPVPSAPDGCRPSLLEWLLRETENVHGRIRRYTSPDEHPFYPDEVPELVLPPLRYPEVLRDTANVNINGKLLDTYINRVVPQITPEGDDSNYGSAAMYDVHCLQALSKRVHYGKFVAEAKFQARPDDYSKLIQARNQDAIMALLTDEVQERRVVDRVCRKAAQYGQDNTEGQAVYKVQPAVVGQLYADWVMPLTKEVQLQYLMARLD